MLPCADSTDVMCPSPPSPLSPIRLRRFASFAEGERGEGESAKANRRIGDSAKGAVPLPVPDRRFAFAGFASGEGDVPIRLFRPSPYSPKANRQMRRCAFLCRFADSPFAFGE